MVTDSPVPASDAPRSDHSGLSQADLFSHAAVSPSLQRQGHAYEMKFVVDGDVVAKVVEWARQNLTPDPFTNRENGDGYLVHTLYLDTPEFSTFFAEPYYRTRKFRLRRYGQEPVIWLEQKRKNKMRVRKRRVSVKESHVVDHLHGDTSSDWDGAWFRRRLQNRQLKPVCQISYQRRAFIGVTSTGPVRLTIDHNLTSSRCSDWRISGEAAENVRILPDHQILELKFRDVLPTLFRGLIDDLHLIPGTFSKYRTSASAVVHELAKCRPDQSPATKEASDAGMA